jgi:hypothetical protein
MNEYNWKEVVFLILVAIFSIVARWKQFYSDFNFSTRNVKWTQYNQKFLGERFK